MPDSQAPPRAGNLLCTIALPANSGYAWAYIERLCAVLADAGAAQGRRTFVAYPRVEEVPEALAGSAAEPVALDFGARTRAALAAQYRFIRAHGVRTLYLSDVATFDPRYAVWRAAGAHYIVVHSHGSGSAPPARGWRRALKQLRARVRWMRADSLVTVSDYVAERERTAALTPPAIVHRLWNAIPLTPEARIAADRAAVRGELGVADDTVLVVMTSRAAHEKGVAHLFRAFDRAVAAEPGRDLRLAFVGGGVDFDEFRALAASLPAGGRIAMLGPRPSSAPYLAAADIVAAPSVYQDALPLAVLEGMAHGRPVIGSTAGGIPEMVRDGIDGLIVPVADEEALADALLTLVRDPARAAAMGRSARARVAAEFNPARMRAVLSRIVLGGPASA